MEESFEVMFTLGGYYTHEILFNYTTFRPIYSGVTVPLSKPKSAMAVPQRELEPQFSH